MNEINVEEMRKRRAKKLKENPRNYQDLFQ